MHSLSQHLLATFIHSVHRFFPSNMSTLLCNISVSQFFLFWGEFINFLYIFKLYGGLVEDRNSLTPCDPSPEDVWMDFFAFCLCLKFWCSSTQSWRLSCWVFRIKAALKIEWHLLIFLFGPVIHENTKNMPSSKTCPEKQGTFPVCVFFLISKTVFKCFSVVFPLRKSH